MVHVAVDATSATYTGAARVPQSVFSACGQGISGGRRPEIPVSRPGPWTGTTRIGIAPWIWPHGESPHPISDSFPCAAEM